jgi:serine/threonine protein kinase
MAEKEMGDYNIIQTVDKSHEYYLGNPVNCSVADTPSNITAIKKCKNSKELIQHLDDLSLLIMEDGGIALNDFADMMEQWTITPENIEKTERVFIEFHRIIMAMNVFLKNNILHFDMKPQNIVYSEKTGRMNIIDFGLSTSIPKLQKQAKSNTNNMALYHWSYPFECHFLNNDTYMSFAELSKTDKDVYYQTILKGIAENNKDNSTKAIQSFYSFIYDNKTDSNEFKQHMKGFYETLMYEMEIDGFATFSKKSIATIDVYGTGIALMYLLKKTKHLLTDNLYRNIHELCNSMVSAQLSKRISAESVLLQYETILTDGDIMEKHKLYFIDHKIKEGKIMTKDIEKKIESIKMGDVILNDAELKENAISAIVHKRSPVAKKTAKKKTTRPRKKSRTLKNVIDSIKMFYLRK